MPVSRLTNFDVWDFYNSFDNRLTFFKANETPFITYPNGIPCYEANMYMNKLLRNGLSRKVKGGTLDNYAHCIIHLIKFCYKSKIRLSQLSNNSFTLFIHGLQAERKITGQLCRDSNRVRDIISQCLTFLVFVQNLHELKNFIGTEKQHAIKIIEKKIKTKKKGTSQTIEENYYSHTAMPDPSEVKKRLPASSEDMLKAWEYIMKIENKEVCERDKIIYQCMEFLGARVTEINMITVQDIENAIASGNNPYINLSTLKRRNGDHRRSIPLAPGILNNIKRYIRICRRKIIKRTIGKKNDHGYLLVSTKTGEHLDTKTITHLVNTWKKGAGINSDFHPHLFRHSFITNKLKEIILQHKEINSTEKFREHLLNTEHFKMELKEWTGHTKASSLDIYINLVFKDLAGYSKTYNAVQLNDSVKVMSQTIEQMKIDIQLKNITTIEALHLLDDSLTAFSLGIKSSLQVVELT